MTAVPAPPLTRYHSDVVLRDGSTIRLRPIEAGDAGQILEFLRGLSSASLYFRFFGTPKLTGAMAAELAGADYRDRFGLVAELAGRIVGVAHAYRTEPRPRHAEVAFAVADALQGRGVGTRMLEQLAVIAREHDIDIFEADVLSENYRMMEVFLDCGFDIERRLEGGVYHVVFPVRLTPAFERRAAERARQAATASMKTFFEPKVVAVVGASRTPGTIGWQLLKNLKDSFRGQVIPVNPRATDIESLPAHARVTDIPGPVDLAFIAVPAPAVECAVDDCVAKGVKALVVISAGFGETGAEGRRREAALVEKVRAAGIRLIGPNCMGILNTDPRVGLNGIFVNARPPEGRVAFSTQSGGLGLAILEYASRLNIGISSFVSVGNKADVSGNDLIQYWAEDPRTDVILLYLESFGNPRNFGRIARRVARQKPIVAVKAGRSTVGARAASSHTGALATSDAVVNALFRQAGVIRTTTLEELFDVAALLAHQPLPAGRRVAIVTNGGGPGILAADACEAHGLEVPGLADATVASLRAFLPSTASVANPVDMIASASADDYRRALQLVLADPNVDAALVIFLPPLVGNPDAVAAAIAEGTKHPSGKPILAVFMSASGAPEGLAGVPNYLFPEPAAAALARVATYAEWKRRPEAAPPALANLQTDAARRIVEGRLQRGGGWLTPIEAQALLLAVGIPVARAEMASSLDAAVTAAAAVGYPVALKAIAPTALHKTEAGAIKLGILERSALEAAYQEFSARFGADLTGVLVQQMVAGGVEVMVGALHDPTFGPLVVYGSGGTQVELWSDVAFRIQPLTEADVEDMLNEVRGTALLRGFRGAPRGDEGALRGILLRLSALLECCPEIHELDLNPVKVLPEGAVAVDVRVRVDPRPAPPRTRRVVY